MLFFFLLVMLGIWRYQGGMMSQAAILPRHVCDRRSRLPEKKTKHMALNINVDKKKQNMVGEEEEARSNGI